MAEEANPVQNIPVAVEAVQAPVTAVTETPIQVAPVTETASVASTEAIAAPEKAPETVLGEALAKPVEEAPKPIPTPEVVAEVKSADTEVKPEATEGQSAEPAPPPTYEPFTLPEGVTLDTERVTKFTEILADLELTGKVPHDFAQQFGQKAVDFHVQEVQNAVENVTKLYQTTWERQKTEWKDSFLKDPEIGGNRFQTTVDSARNFIRTHGGTSEQQTEFRNLMETSGLGNHPAVIRLLANAGSAMTEGRPLANVKPVAQPKSKTATMYGSPKVG